MGQLPYVMVNVPDQVSCGALRGVQPIDPHGSLTIDCCPDPVTEIVFGKGPDPVTHLNRSAGTIALRLPSARVTTMSAVLGAELPGSATVI